MGFLLCIGMVLAILYFLGVPIWETKRGENSDLSGQILFARTMKEPSELRLKELVKEIFIMDLKMGRTRQLTDHQTVSIRPEMSPVGNWMIYTSFIYHSKSKKIIADLFAYDLLTRERRILSHKKGLNLSGSFDEKGEKIYYTIRQGSMVDIFRIGLNGEGFERITKGEFRKNSKNGRISHSEPAISPDGSRMAFVSDKEGRSTLYIRDIEKSKDIQILQAGVFNTLARWSPNGRLLTFQGYLKGHFDIFTVDANGENLRKISRAKNPAGLPANNEYPSFSPDGRKIIFVSDRTGYNQIYVSDIDGKNLRRITYDTFHYFYPKWIQKVLPTTVD